MLTENKNIITKEKDKSLTPETPATRGGGGEPLSHKAFGRPAKAGKFNQSEVFIFYCSLRKSKFLSRFLQFPLVFGERGTIMLNLFRHFTPLALYLSLVNFLPDSEKYMEGR